MKPYATCLAFEFDPPIESPHYPRVQIYGSTGQMEYGDDSLMIFYRLTLLTAGPKRVSIRRWREGALLNVSWAIGLHTTVYFESMKFAEDFAGGLRVVGYPEAEVLK